MISENSVSERVVYRERDMRRKIIIGKETVTVPPVVIGCMRISSKTKAEVGSFIHNAMDMGLSYFDHADIYGGGECEKIFGDVMASDRSLRREDMVIQSKCGIRNGFYDHSKEYIMESADGILSRLRTDYLDVLLLHRPDALTEPEEVAEAFDRLSAAGKVRAFGVSNYNPMQIELLQKYTDHRIVIDQLQFSIPVSGMVTSGMEVNMVTPGACDRDGSVLDYCRLKDITIQAWSPFQMPEWKGPFIGASEYRELNTVLEEIAARYDATPTAVASAWILRHPAGMQIVSGTTDESRLREIISGKDIRLTREEWYRVYLAAGNILP